MIGLQFLGIEVDLGFYLNELSMENQKKQIKEIIILGIFQNFDIQTLLYPFKYLNLK